MSRKRLRSECPPTQVTTHKTQRTAPPTAKVAVVEDWAPKVPTAKDAARVAKLESMLAKLQANLGDDGNSWSCSKESDHADDTSPYGEDFEVTLEFLKSLPTQSDIWQMDHQDLAKRIRKYLDKQKHEWAANFDYNEVEGRIRELRNRMQECKNIASFETSITYLERRLAGIKRGRGDGLTQQQRAEAARNGDEEQYRGMDKRELAEHLEDLLECVQRTIDVRNGAMPEKGLDWF